MPRRRGPLSGEGVFSDLRGPRRASYMTRTNAATTSTITSQITSAPFFPGAARSGLGAAELAELPRLQILVDDNSVCDDEPIAPVVGDDSDAKLAKRGLELDVRQRCELEGDSPGAE